ncbi:LegC family aminotransferase [Paenibacillus sp.]|uniref:LegC family aminotransferase n=1 Tax=Paenibacillus sp. TaxID=58172 RepID=UPI002D4640C7|nr:LegC family aminotransferase [Paenibacillus sp.]HZG87397.1 LegC family aminotransferase [Paenibacillus sp.]
MITADVIQALDSIFQNRSAPLALHEPQFSGNEWAYVKECLDTGWVSSVGKYVDLFEQKLAEAAGVRRAVAVVNGTAALHICLQLCGVEPGDEVLIPALTFVATANAVSYCGAVPHFVDSEASTLGIDPRKLDRYLADIAVLKEGVCHNKHTGRRIKAVVPMHTFGHPVDLDSLMDVCRTYGIELIEDAAESLGSFYKGRHTGGFGKAAALSFNGNKIITTGGGGAIVTNDEQLADRAKHITTTAKLPHRWDFFHDEIGYNYRLPNLNAALGCAQLEQMPAFLENKRRLAAKYEEAFRDVPGVAFFTEPSFARSNYWLNALLLDDQFTDQKDDLLAALHQSGYLSRPVWTLLNRLPMFRDCPAMDLSCAERLERSIINLPSSAKLGEGL